MGPRVFVGLNADHEVLERGVFLRHVMNVIRRDDGNAQLPSHRNQMIVGELLLLESVVLHLQVEALRPEYLSERAGVGPGLGDLVVDDVVRDGPAQAGGGRDQPLPMLLEHFEVDSGPVVEPLEVRLRCELEEVSVSLDILGEQKQVIGAAIPDRCLALGQVRLDADDRVQPGGGRFPVPVQRGVHDAVIGHGDVLDPEFLRAIDVLRHAAEAVEERVLSMQV